MSFGDDQPMEVDVDEQELQRNRIEESVLSVLPSMANSDPTGDSLTNENDLSPLSPEMVQSLYSEDVTIQLKAMERIRKLLLDTPNPLRDEIIKSGAIPRLIHFLADSRYPELQFESGWVLIYITSGNSAQTQVVIESGAVSVLIKLLTSSQNENVLEQSISALGNIAFDSTECRDFVLNSNVLPPLLGRFNNSNLSTLMMRKVAWALSGLCCGKPPPNFAQVSQCLPLLARLMANEDATVLIDVCQTLCSLIDGPNEQIQVVIDSGVCPRAVQLFSHTSTKVVKAALDLVMNIAAGDDSQAQVIIKANALPALGRLLSHEKEFIVKNACRTLANITSGNRRQIQAVIDGNVFPSLIKLLHHGDIEIRKQAARAITNATFTKHAQQIMYLVEAGAIAPLCNLLTKTDSDLTTFAFTCLENILRAGESFARITGSTVNPYAFLICNSPEMKLALFFENTAVQFDARRRFCKLLSNSTGDDSTQTQVDINSGAVPSLIRRLSYSIREVVEQLVRALGTKVRDSTEFRHLVPSDHVLPPFLGLFNGSHLKASMMRIATWTLSCLCFGNRRAKVQQCLPILTSLLFKQNANVLAGSCFALAYFGEGSNEKLQAIIKSGVLPRAVQLLSHSSTKVVSAALHLVFLIITADDSQTQVIIKALPAFGRLLLHEKESIVVEACLILASITAAGNERQIQALIDANLVHLLIEHLHYGDTKIRQSAAWTLANATSYGGEEQIVYIVEAGVILPLCNCLYGTDLDLMEEALICLVNILRTGQGISNAADSNENVYATLVKRWAGFDKIAFLSSHSDPKIKEAALIILKMLSGSKLKYNSH